MYLEKIFSGLSMSYGFVLVKKFLLKTNSQSDLSLIQGVFLFEKVCEALKLPFETNTE